MSSDGNPQEIEIKLMDLFPTSWVDADGKVGVLQSVHTCFGYSPGTIAPGYLTGRIQDVVYLVFETQKLTYVSISLEFVGFKAKSPQFVSKPEEKTAPAGTYLMFFTRYRQGGPVSEKEAIARIEYARGLLTAIEGRNATYSHLYSCEVVLPDGKTSAVSAPIENPASFPTPFTNVARSSDIASSLNGLAGSVLQRVLLSLRWYDKAARDSDPLDSFLKLWFALETLAMPDTTNIKRISEMLAQVYGKSVAESASHFRVGRLFGLRSAIVHEGEVHAIHQQLQNYLQAIFVDCFLFVCGQPAEYLADAVLSDTAFQTTDWMP